MAFTKNATNDFKISQKQGDCGEGQKRREDKL